jgi:asparagine synthase (glutamine-hydrolysing)
MMMKITIKKIIKAFVPYGLLYLLTKLKNRNIKRAGSSIPPDALELVNNIKAKNLTYLSERKLGSIADTIKSVKIKNLEGIFIEAGCALGGSTVLIGKIKDREIPLYVYDVFGLIPAPTEQDTKDAHERYKNIVSGKSGGIGGEEYYGYQNNLYETVIQNLKYFGLDSQDNNIVLIKGLLQDTMEVKQPVAFAHIDVDWYEPVKFCLEKICPKLVVEGSMIFDDYHDWGGCRKAVDEYLRTVIGQFVLDDSAGSVKITRVKNPADQKNST